MSQFRQEEEKDYSSGDGEGSGYRCYNSGDGSASDQEFTITLGGHEVTFYQLPSDRTIGHGAVVWEAAVIFAKYMEYCVNKNLSIVALTGKTVLELGSGTGLGGLSLVLRGAHVTSTDLQPVCDALLYDNTKRLFNQLKTQVGNGTAGVMEVPLVCPIVYPVDWSDELNIQRLACHACDVNTDPKVDFLHYKRDSESILSSMFSGSFDAEAPPTAAEVAKDMRALAAEPAATAVAAAKAAAAKEAAAAGAGEEADAQDLPYVAPIVPTLPYDIILLTDCVFSAPLVPALVRTILAASGPKTTVYCVHEIRDVEANNAFLDELGKYFKIKSVPQKEQHPDYRHSQVQLIIAKPRPLKKLVP